MSELREYIQRATHNLDRSSLGGTDEKWDGYLLGVEDATAAAEAVDSVPWVASLLRGRASEYEQKGMRDSEVWRVGVALKMAYELRGVANELEKR